MWSEVEEEERWGRGPQQDEGGGVLCEFNSMCL